MPELTERRPKVFLDSEGAEWRYVVDHLEVRDFEDDPPEGEEDEDYEHHPRPRTRVLETVWRKWGDPFDTQSWIAYLESIPWMAASCLPAVNAALAHPMTAEEAAADDALWSQETP